MLQGLEVLDGPCETARRWGGSRSGGDRAGTGATTGGADAGTTAASPLGLLRILSAVRFR